MLEGEKTSATVPPPPRTRPRRRGLRRLRLALGHSLVGLMTCFESEEAVRIELGLLLAGVPLALALGESAVETVLLIGVLLLVLIVEFLNCGIERAIDRISFEHHDLSKQAKDAGSAAVFLSLILAGMVWLFVGLL